MGQRFMIRFRIGIQQQSGFSKMPGSGSGFSSMPGSGSGLETLQERYIKNTKYNNIAAVSFFLYNLILHFRFKLNPIGIYNQAFPGPRLAFLLQLQVHLRYSTIGYLYSARGQSATNDPLKENFLKSFRNRNELWTSGSATVNSISKDLEYNHC
jgi:hypothetical protein